MNFCLTYKLSFCHIYVFSSFNLLVFSYIQCSISSPWFWRHGETGWWRTQGADVLISMARGLIWVTIEFGFKIGPFFQTIFGILVDGKKLSSVPHLRLQLPKMPCLWFHWLVGAREDREVNLWMWCVFFLHRLVCILLFLYTTILWLIVWEKLCNMIGLKRCWPKQAYLLPTAD